MPVIRQAPTRWNVSFRCPKSDTSRQDAAMFDYFNDSLPFAIGAVQVRCGSGHLRARRSRRPGVLDGMRKGSDGRQSKQTVETELCLPATHPGQRPGFHSVQRAACRWLGVGESTIGCFPLLRLRYQNVVKKHSSRPPGREIACRRNAMKSGFRSCPSWRSVGMPRFADLNNSIRFPHVL